jgi:hypothetical protein
MNPSQSLKSQDEPCKPDCLSDNWVPPYPNSPYSIPILLEECDITIFVKFRWRNACSQYYDYYFESFKWPSEDIDENCINSTFGGIAGFIDHLTKRLLEMDHINASPPFPCNPFNCPGQPPNHFHNPPNSCFDNWRVIKGACWKLDSQKRKMAVCQEGTCCLERFKVCISTDGTRREATKDQVVVPGVCDPPEENCYPICGSVYR